MDRVFGAVGFLILVIVYRAYRRYTGISLADVPGPDSPSFMMGMSQELYQGLAAEADFKWQAQYGNVIRFKGPFNEDQLMISDPAALQYIFVKLGYRFPKQRERLAIAKVLNGKGVTWAAGEDHKRQRKVLSPGFGAPESKAFLPLFQGCAESLSNKWMDIITNSKEQSAVLNIPAWLSRATLDAIGQAAFDVRFGSIDNKESALARAYSNMMNDIFGSPSNGQILFREISKYIPDRILQCLTETSNNPRIQRAREVASLATSLAKQMVTDKAEMLLEGKGSRDVFSLLGVCTPSFRSSTSNRSTVKANMDTDAKEKLTEEELETEAAIHARGDAEFTVTDLDDMTYATAFMKEVLRFHPVVYQVYRCADQDDVLPLSQPITTRFGKVIYELPVPKGTRIVASLAAYNRNKDLWGDDAHVFNPERWINGAANEKKATSIGVYSNLMTFLGGVRACIGWRFAVIEIQAFLTEVVGKFEFALTDQSGRVRREASVVMTPTLEGEIEKGVQLPLRVSVAPLTENGY
ncbi:cytochrome P450 [Rhizopogon vinicolor AM-OR11-026]|uniref:Cytochrome P450 n=1 Tax=Rhizopogon vinicolor AM-OR11-026 TaxID=1314800 RepID=A0A1B7MTP0_9AGAM|nr:cytochrome P450 [Rhizopogon vinicolor AM-OR11-026]